MGLYGDQFKEKVAIVTGAGGGIGQAYAEALAREGAAVVVADINVEGAQKVADGIKGEGGNALAVRVDVSDPDSAKEMAAQTLSEFGGIDYLVNNAAIFGGMKLDFLVSVDWDYYKKFMSVNMDGALLCTRAVYRKMAKRGGGAIVNQSSTAAWLYSNFYGLAKVGINGLTQQLATELGGQNIRDQRDRARAHRHRGQPDHHAAGDGRRHREGNSVVAHGRTGGPGRHVSVPAVGSGQVDHRADLQRRRRTDLPVMTLRELTTTEARLHRPGQPGRADGQAARRMARRAGRLRRPHRGDDAAGRARRHAGRQRGRRRRRPTSSASPCSTTRRCATSSAELAAHAKPGTVIAIHSTIEPDTAGELAEQLRPKGIHIVDAPVSGGAGAADKGELAVMVGADDEAYDTVKPVFKQWASMVVRAGEPGAGTRMKLARNMLTFIGFAAACEAQKLAEAAGIDLQKLGRVVRHSDAQSGGPGAIMVRDDTKPLQPDHFVYDMFVHTRGLAEKDLGLALALGRGQRRGPAAGRDRAARPGRRTRRAAYDFDDEGVDAWTNCAARASRR